jgi:predicted helicase
MRRAIAFAGNIAESKLIEQLFQSVTDYYVSATDQQSSDGRNPLKCTVQHVDGGMNALERNTKLDWLRGEPADGACRILTNARCLSEGVDVPALDAVMFLSPRKSVVDIVQSVGRVMRLDPKGEKKFGYIILPIGIPSGMTPEEALRDNQRYGVVWEILQALRAHDERFDAMVNRISLSKARDRKVNVIGVGGDQQWGDQGTLDLAFPDLDQWRDAIYAKIVQKVGSREYWTDWAKDVASIAERQITRISALLNDPDTGVREKFDEFLDGIRGNLNDNITEDDAVEMLAQHLITRPVFNALFAGDDFLDNNPVAITMEKMLAVLDQHDLEAENESLHKFYDSVRRKVADVKDREGRQELVRRLYDTFFATAFKKTVEKLGIVYTPVQIVDFILRSADEVLKQEFGQSLSDEGVHILDGFTGTGTFIVRLLELGLIKPHDLARKYVEELHANEILLLAYYIAAVNIETTYMGVRRNALIEPASAGGNAEGGMVSVDSVGYESFPGLILTDTFQSWEDDDHPDLRIFPENNDRLERLKKLPITVIVGNPPYSVGQESANDNNANEKYPSLDASIRATYAEQSAATNKNSLYNSYIRAIKWATQRVQKRGVIAYVTANGFLDSNSADGLRKSLADEFTKIFILDLKGNQKGDWRKEGGKVFGVGSQSGITIVILVKGEMRSNARAVITYASVGDFLSAEQKLNKISSAESIYGLDAIDIKPNEHGDWLSQRNDEFLYFLPLGEKEGVSSVFQLYSGGLKTNRDAWCYSFSHAAVQANMKRLIATYERDRNAGRTSANATRENSQISWNRSLLKDLDSGRARTFDAKALIPAAYRPFMVQQAYFSRALNDMVYRLPALFPSGRHVNYGFYVLNPGAEKPFSVLAVQRMPDLAFFGSNAGQFFARWRYESAEDAGMLDFAVGDEEVADGYRKIDNITDEALQRFQAAYGRRVTRDDIFFYVYGLLHSPEYRETYAADLKKMLPRIALVEDPWPFVDAGRELSELHLGYESVTPYPLDGLDVEPSGDPYDFFAVQKMTFMKKRDPETKKLIADKSAIVYNQRIILSGIPEDAYRYMLGSRSAIEWIIDRYQVKTDKPSGIVNDPNDWSREVGNPRYIVDLLARIVTVSLQTNQIVDNLPRLAIRKDRNPK